MIEKKTFKIELPCEENLLMIEHEVDVQMEFEEEHLSMEVDGFRGIRTTLKTWEIDSVDNTYYGSLDKKFQEDVYKEIEKVIYE